MASSVLFLLQYFVLCFFFVSDSEPMNSVYRRLFRLVGFVRRSAVVSGFFCACFFVSRLQQIILGIFTVPFLVPGLGHLVTFVARYEHRTGYHG